MLIFLKGEKNKGSFWSLEFAVIVNLLPACKQEAAVYIWSQPIQLAQIGWLNFFNDYPMKF